MFGGRYFGKRYFAQRYYPPISGPADPNAMVATIAGAGSLSGQLNALGIMVSTLVGEGFVTGTITDAGGSTPSVLRSRTMMGVGL